MKFERCLFLVSKNDFLQSQELDHKQIHLPPGLNKEDHTLIAIINIDLET